MCIRDRPILMPPLRGTMLLLFGNAFGAYATAYALTGGTLNLITIQIGAQMRGDVSVSYTHLTLPTSDLV